MLYYQANRDRNYTKIDLDYNIKKKDESLLWKYYKRRIEIYFMKNYWHG
jgi:hypothetical protein